MEKEEKKEKIVREKVETTEKTKKDVKEIKKEITKNETPVKEVAIAFGKSLPISSKHCFAICKMIKNKSPEKAIDLLELVVKKKKAVRMYNREVPHRKGNIMSGRYPVNACKELIGVIKQLKANASVNGVENAIIVLAKADKASRPYRREGRKAKRTHVYFEARDKNKLKKGKKQIKKDLKKNKKITKDIKK